VDVVEGLHESIPQHHVEEPEESDDEMRKEREER
jgi:hypothetical protein